MNPLTRFSLIMAGLSATLLCAALAWMAVVPGESIVAVLLFVAAFGSGTNAVIFWRARNRRVAPTNATAVPGPIGPQFVGADMLAASSGRRIPWRGGTGTLTVNRPAFGKTTAIMVDGVVVATPTRAIVASPWVECPLPGSDPELMVVQVQQERYLFRVLVFANGISLGDGSTLDAWRARKPIPLDEFEQVFQPPGFGLPGAIGLGLICLLAGLSRMANDHQSLDVSWVAVLALAFAIPAGWMMLTVGLVHWLRTKRSWPWRLRRLMVIAFLLGAPLAILGVIGAAASAAGAIK